MKHRLGFILVATIAALSLLTPAAAASELGVIPAARFLKPSRFDSYIVVMKLGLVQHVGPGGSLMGQTMVEVDNR